MRYTIFILFLCLSAIAHAQVPSYIPTDGLVGWWPFNGNANDESGNGHNGAPLNISFYADRFGAANSAVKFENTTSSYISSNIGVQDTLTISLWYSCSSQSQYYPTLLDYGNSVNASLPVTRYLIHIAGQEPSWINTFTGRAYIQTNVGGDGGLADTKITTDSQWHNLVSVFIPNDNAYMYIDGVLIGQDALSNSQVYSGSLFFGRDANDNAGECYACGRYEGLLDDVAIWNRSLTPCEIRALFLAGNSSIAVFNDIDQNCTQETEIGIEGINVLIQPGNIIATTDSMGIAILPMLDDGVYTATIDTTNLNWSTQCSTTQTLNVINSVSECIGFGLINDNPCANPDVSLQAPFLRRCFSDQKVYVQACNGITATGVLSDSYVDLELDALMQVNGASMSYTSLGDNVFRFETGNISPGQCASFNVSTTISCDAMLGETLCMEATLYPIDSCVLDSIPSEPPVFDGDGDVLDGLPQPCELPWDQSSLSVEGWCQNDTIYFTITNTGDPGEGNMECYSPLWITVDGEITFTDSILIPGGQTITYSFPGDGKTWILNAEQHPLHPGNSHPNAHVEACGDLNNWTSDQVNDFPLNDADPVVDIYCGLVTGAYDPNDKTGYPQGRGEEKNIYKDITLQYLIRFQNTGTDTAFTVVIRDTLDMDLNIFTVKPGVASHSCEFRMYGPRVLEWTFDNILLPDSTTNEPGSHGFVTFEVDLIKDLVPGTEITNEADIYFDYNEPIITNQTFHRISQFVASVAVPIICEGDFNGDGYRGSIDLLVFLSDYGCPEMCITDLTGDGITNTSDLLVFLSHYGTVCP